jgi:transposase
MRDLKLCFSKLYAKTGRPSIAPEKLLRALLLQVLYSVRSERLLMEQLNYNLLFRWFVGFKPGSRLLQKGVSPAGRRVHRTHYHN